MLLPLTETCFACLRSVSTPKLLAENTDEGIGTSPYLPALIADVRRSSSKPWYHDLDNGMPVSFPPLPNIVIQTFSLVLPTDLRSAPLPPSLHFSLLLWHHLMSSRSGTPPSHSSCKSDKSPPASRTRRTRPRDRSRRAAHPSRSHSISYTSPSLHPQLHTS